MKRSALFFTSPGRIEVVEEEAGGGVSEEAVVVQTIVSAVSAGTEALFYRGLVPEGMSVDSAIHGMQQPVRYPLKYGYAAVGRVVDTGKNVDPLWRDAIVFALHPHESWFIASPDELVRIPEGLDPEDAVLLAMMETAVTLTLDGAPAIGEDVVVFGQGVLGLLTTALLAAHPIERLLTVEPVASRRQRSVAMGAAASFAPGEALCRIEESFGTRGADLSFEVSGDPAVLEDAVSMTGFSGRVVVGSWYGAKKAPIALGGPFHRSRIQLRASQVSTIDPARTGRWTRERRLHLALSMIARIHPSVLVTDRVPIADAPAAYEKISRYPEDVLQVLLTYGA